MKSTTIAMITAALLTSFSAMAGVKIVGNGGDAVRLDIVSVHQQLARICDDIKTLRAANVSCFDIRQVIQNLGQNDEHLHITDSVDLGDGVQRSGKNVPETMDITYSRSYWLQTGLDRRVKLGIVLHEILGLLNIEHTDDYHISSLVLDELAWREQSNRQESSAKDPVAKDRCSRLKNTWGRLQRDYDKVVLDGLQGNFKQVRLKEIEIQREKLRSQYKELDCQRYE